MHPPDPARAQAAGSARLTLCMIVRDEAENLPRCLASVKGLADELIVVDTGSTDATPDIARAQGATVLTCPWTDDFAAARNHGLALATGEWILVLDADEEVAPDTRHTLPALLADTGVAGYLVQIINLLTPGDAPEQELSTALRLFRNHPAYRFAGALHEQVAPAMARATPDAVIRPAPLRILHHGYQARVMTDRGKGERNRRIAERMVAAAPHDPYAHGGLAVEYFLAGEFAAAADSFRHALDRAETGSAWHAQLAKQLALALCHQERWAEAADLLAATLPLYPRYTDLLYLYGLALQQTGDHPGAATALVQCLIAGPAPCPPYTSVDPEAGGQKAQLALALLAQTTSAN